VRAIYLGSAQGVLKLDLPVPELAAVPTLSDWSMLLLALALSIAAATKLRGPGPA
jgi:exosortase sorting signal-containing protein